MNKKFDSNKSDQKIDRRSYSEKEQENFINNIAQILNNSKYDDKDNEDM